MVLMPLAHPACRLGPGARAGSRCAGSASAPTASTSGTSRSSSSPPPAASPTGAEPLRERAAGGGDLRRSRRSPGSYVEEPIRHGAIGRLWRPPPRRRLAAAETSRREGWAAVGVAAVVLVARRAPAWPGVNSAAAEGADERVEEARAAGATKPAPLTPAQAAASTRSSCKAVVHIGDSTSEGLTSPEYLPLESQRIEAQYADVGANEQHMEISGARSIEEQLRRRTERPGSGRSVEARRLQRLLGAGARDQRGGQRRRRLQRRRDANGSKS